MDRRFPKARGPFAGVLGLSRGIYIRLFEGYTGFIGFARVRAAFLSLLNLRFQFYGVYVVFSKSSKSKPRLRPVHLSV